VPVFAKQDKQVDIRAGMKFAAPITADGDQGDVSTTGTGKVYPDLL